MDTCFEVHPDDLAALKALLIGRQNVLAVRAELLQAAAIVAIAQAEVADTKAVIEELKLRIAKAATTKGAVGRASQAVARLSRYGDRRRHLCHRG